MQSLVCKKDPASKLWQLSAEEPEFHLYICWPTKQSHNALLNENFCFFIPLTWFSTWCFNFFVCFLSSFHFLFKFQDICPCARIAAVLFLELVCSYCTDKHWAFWRKLDFPSSLIRCCCPQVEANIYLENNRHLGFCLWKEFTLSGATCVLSETEILSPLDFSKIFLPC